MASRLVQKLVDQATPAAGTVTLLLGLPEDVDYAVLHVKGTTAAVSTIDAKIQQLLPDQTGAIDVPGAAIDQIAAGGTDVSRFLFWGRDIVAMAGTGIDAVAAPASIFQRLSYTLAGTVTNLKIWVEAYRNN